MARKSVCMHGRSFLGLHYNCTHLLQNYQEFSVPVTINLSWTSELTEKVQKRATEILPALRHLAYPDRLNACKLTTIHTDK